MIASFLIMFLAVPFAEAASTLRQGLPPRQQIQGIDALQDRSDTTIPAPNNPSANTTTPRTLFVDPEFLRPRAIALDQQSSPAPIAPEQQQQQNSTSMPLGTAVAPDEKTVGVAASRPAGAVIAPAKQRRTRSILIKVGVLLGACVALGTVLALSAGSPSRPH